MNIPQSWQGAPLRHVWTYRDPRGEPLGHVARYGMNGRKQVIPFFSRNGSGFKPGAADEPRPLFGLDKLAGNPDGKAVVIVEGEKCAHALQSLGVVALTSLGGSNAAAKSDWSPLNGIRKAYLLPDADEPGQAYIRDVIACLRALPEPPDVFIVRLPWLPDKGDVVDWLQASCPGWDGFELLPEAEHERLFSEFRQAVKDYAEPAPVHSVTVGDEWPEPMSLDAAELPAWPRDVLPEPLESFVLALSEATETPVELPAMMVLPSVAAAAQGRFVVRVKPGYQEPVNIWTATALKPGNRKTAVVLACLEPLLGYERAKDLELAPIIRKAESDKKTAEARVASLRAKAAKEQDDFEYDLLRHEVARMEAAIIEPPKAPRLVSDDCTPEQLGVLMSEHNGRISSMSDEAGIFELMAGRYSQGIPNLDVYLKGHAGSHLIVDRGSRPPIHISNPCLTIGISPQPSVLTGLASKPGFRGRGLLARFLWALPPSNLGTRTGGGNAVPESIRGRYAAMLESILSLPTASEPDGTPSPYVLPFSHAAYAVWFDFWKRTERGMAEGGRFEHVTDWAGKLPGAVARIAGLLHVARYAHDGPQGREIGQADVEAAIMIGDVLSAHALAVFGLMGADESLDGARAILRWIRRTGRESFTAGECYRENRARFKNPDEVPPCLATLEGHECVRLLPSEPNPRRGRPGRAYVVNPRLSQ